MNKYIILFFSLFCLSNTIQAQVCTSFVSWDIDNSLCPFLNITITTTGGFAPYTVDFSSGESYNLQFTGASLSVPLPLATNFVTVTDNVGAVCTFNKEIYLGGLTLGGIFETKPSCPMASDGSLSILPTGGYGNFLSTIWTLPGGMVIGNTNQIDNLEEGWYVVTVTDDYECSVTQTYFLSAETSSDLTISGVNVIDAACGDNGEIDIFVENGCSPYEIDWSNGLSGTNLTNLVNLTAGDYGVTVTDCNGCTYEEFITVGEVPELLMAYEDIPGCLGNITVTGGCPPYQYMVDGSILTQSTPICDYPVGNYVISVIDACGCTVVEPILVISADPILITVDGLTAPGCLDGLNGAFDGAIDISVVGGDGNYSYVWSQGSNTQDIAGLSEGIYSVTVSDGLGNTSVQTIELIQISYTDLEVTSAIITNADCANLGGAISLEVEGGCIPYLFQWSDNSTSGNITDLMPGVYTVTILDCNGCGVVEQYIVEEDTEVPVVEVTTSPGCIDAINVSSSCPDFAITIGGLDLGPLPICNLAAGIYTVEVTEACTGCQVTVSVLIEENPIIVDIDSLVFPGCLTGINDGAIDIYVTGGVPDYTYLWNTGATTQDIDNLEAGTYELTVTDSNNSTVVLSVDLQQQPFAVDDYLIGCENSTGNAGFIELELNPFGETYLFSWSNGSTDQNQYNLVSGVYFVTITSATGCEYLPGPYFVCHDSMQLNLDTMVCAGTEVLLDAQFDDNIDFLGWADPAGNEIECDACPETSVFPHETRTYTALYNSPVFGLFDYSFTIEVIPGCMWPGDTDSSTVVDLFDLFPILLEYGTTGPARSNPDIDWYGHMGPDYGINMAINNIDAKHADCNGDGIIDLNDAAAIVANWGETHKSLTVGEKNGVPIYVEQDTVYEAGATLSLPVIVGNMDTMAVEIYAIGFSINFDPEIMVNESASLEISDSWFSNGSVPMGIVQKEFAEAGRLDVAVGRTDLMNVSGNGQIANFIITMEDDILKADPNKEFEITVDNVRMINVEGEEIEGQGLTTTSILVDSSTVAVNDLEELNKRLFIFPNPTLPGNKIQIVTSLNVESYQLINLNGQLLQTGQIRKGKKGITLDTQLSSGLYIMQIDGDFGRLTQKLIVE